MILTKEEERMLAGEFGNAARKSMEILTALGKIYRADRLIPIVSVQVAGVSYHNLGEAGLEYLAELAEDGKVRVKTTLNPAGMDIKNWKGLGIPEEFAKKQMRVIDAFSKMGISPSCTCTPYLIGNKPNFGDHIAWSESSAVAYANSVIGARTNREGGPSALAAALVGKTPNYGLHLKENRKPEIEVAVSAVLDSTPKWGALGYVLGRVAENKIAYITGIRHAEQEWLRSFGASSVTYGSKPLYHIEGLTPEAGLFDVPKESIEVSEAEISSALRALEDDGDDIDFVSIGCPHASVEELKRIAKLLEGKKVKVEFWISLARKIKEQADKLGLVRQIEASGAKFACDTCLAVAPIRGRFKHVATNSAKACFYARGHNKMKTKIGTLEQCIEAAVTGKWR